MFVPTRAEVEQAGRGAWASSGRALTTAFYHGGEPIRVIRPFLEGEVEQPFLLAMTAAGQSALNVRGLDTVVIDDARYGNVVERGRNVLHRLHLGANEILQMAGRVHGRVAGGEVFILSDRDIDFEHAPAHGARVPARRRLRAGGDHLRRARRGRAATSTCRCRSTAIAYRRALRAAHERAASSRTGGSRATAARSRRCRWSAPWAELLVHADDELVPDRRGVLQHRVAAPHDARGARPARGASCNGSDHLTAYNLYAEAVNQHGLRGRGVRPAAPPVRRKALAEWAERRGVLVKAIEDAALGMASVYRVARAAAAEAAAVCREGASGSAFADLLARFMPFDLVIDEQTARRAGGAGLEDDRWRAAGARSPGELRYFADRFGVPRASIEGTTLSYDLVREHAGARRRRGWCSTGPRKHQGLAVERRLSYFGFDLDTEVEPIRGTIPEPLRAAARDVLADALLAGETTHPDQGRIKRALAVLDELWRRSGGALAGDLARGGAPPDPRAARDRGQLGRLPAHPARPRPAALVDEATRERLDALPAMVRVRGRRRAARLRAGRRRRAWPGSGCARDRPGGSGRASFRRSTGRSALPCCGAGTRRSWPTRSRSCSGAQPRAPLEPRRRRR